jgi:hypothetical protein
MADQFQIAGAVGTQSDYAPLHVNRMITGYWTNTNPLRDAATTEFVEKFYGGRQDRIADGFNTELSTRLTLRRRPGSSVYNSQLFPAINRFYGWNTFSLNSEQVRVMVDCGGGGGAVYDGTGPNTKTLIFTKGANAGKTFFLGVGNTLYMTDGVENLQLNNATGQVTRWGIDAPAAAPTVRQVARPNPYPAWAANAVFCSNEIIGGLVILGGGYLQLATTFGYTGAAEPNPWNPVPYEGTADGGVEWQNRGANGWQANHNYAYGDITSGIVNGVQYLYWCVSPGQSGANNPTWMPGLGTLVPDNQVTWQCGGILLLSWNDIGPNTQIIGASPTVNSSGGIVDPSGYLQLVAQPGKTGAAPGPTWQDEPGAYTQDNTAVWLNGGPFASGATAPRQYGYAYQNSANSDLSNMSPASAQISVSVGGQVIVQGVGTGQDGVDTIPIYRTAQGGSTFFLLATIPNPGDGVVWTYTDTTPDSGLSPVIQAQVNGEGTPLPVGATCMEYHLGRIAAAVDNVVYLSSGPDAINAGSNGNAGFDTTFTAQSRITRFWVNSLGLVVFTVRDAYIILGSGTPNDPLYMTKYIDNIPLLNYDAFAVFLTTPYMLSGHGMVNALDPASGIVEASFPIADQIAAMGPKTSYVTFHNGGSGETALYVSDGELYWYRMAPTSAPESGLNWNPATYIMGGTSAVQSTEVLPGTYKLLIGPAHGPDPNTSQTGPILMRDPTVNSDNGQDYPAWAEVGNVVLAHSGQLAGLAWMALESAGEGSATKLSVMLDEISELPPPSSAQFYEVPRTRQDPPNAPPIQSYYSNRHSLLQGQKTVWCKSLKMRFEWPPEDAANELYTYTIFGETWAEQRSQ